jgi:2-polyprenyl-3-methyl-5-hydroxy-6-metoxy-1,4-benzoquinol methylase
MDAAQAKALWEAGDTEGGLEAAWAVFDATGDPEAKLLIGRILRADHGALTATRAMMLAPLLSDPEVDPGMVSAAGWKYLLRDTDLFAPECDPAALAARLEHHALALTLLREDVVSLSDAEQSLTAARRWLLLLQRWHDFPALRDALLAQAAHNGGAWPFDAQERAALADAADFAAAYLPARPVAPPAPAYTDAVTRKVAEQYESWPYPVWTRPARYKPQSWTAEIRKLDPDGPPFPENPDVLIAGCGTGKQIALTALARTGGNYLAIDIARTSVAAARKNCEDAGVTGVEYHVMDLHDVASLNRQFDAVLTTGVLHHLPDPEAGWQALAKVLKPGGVMHVMVYSLVARLRVKAWRQFLGPLLQGPMSDDRLREIRARIMTLPPNMRPVTRDFQSLAGTHDLVAHRHEDPFTAARIRDTLDATGLELLRFNLPSPKYRERYRAEHPHDMAQRDLGALTKFERAYPTVFAAMYDIWCRKPA